jgi:hypothetical protein
MTRSAPLSTRRRRLLLALIALFAVVATAELLPAVFQGSMPASLIVFAVVAFTLGSVLEIARLRRQGKDEMADSLLRWAVGASSILWVVSSSGEMRREHAVEHCAESRDQ